MARLILSAILLLALALRLLGIDAPIAGEQEMRQRHTAQIARNFHEQGYRLFHPQIDWDGAGPGYVESEFPAFPFGVALGYAIVGVDVALGRGLAALLSVVGIAFMVRLVSDLCGRSCALWSAFFLAVLPSNVFFGRAFMPEPLLLMASAAGLSCFARWTRSERARDYWASAFFVSLACVVKPPALVLGAPLLALAWLRDGRGVLRRRALWLYAACVAIPFAAWYLHAHQLRLETGLSFGIWGYGSDKWGNWELVSQPHYWRVIAFDRLAKTHLTWAGFGIFLAGFALPRHSREEWVFDIWLLAIVVSFAIVGVGNLEHSYYQLPFTLPAAVFMGKLYARHFHVRALTQGPRRPRLLAVALLLVLVSVPALSADRWQKLRARELRAPESAAPTGERPTRGGPDMAGHLGEHAWPRSDS